MLDVPATRQLRNWSQNSYEREQEGIHSERENTVGCGERDEAEKAMGCE